MTIITVANSKGGVGKSLVSGQLAVLAAAENNRTVLIDADPQQSALRFRNRRKKDDFTAIAPSGKIRSDLKSLESSFDVAIIDCGGHDSNILIEAAGLAHLLLIPVEPGQSEYDSVKDLTAKLSPILDAKRQVGAPFAARILLNRVDSRTALGKEFKNTMTVFEDFAPVMSAKLGFLVDFKYADAAGEGICEYSNASYAAAEMRAAWKELKTTLGSLQNG